MLKTFTVLLAVLALSGCLRGLDRHGKQIKKMYVDQFTIETILPKNAPSISQHFRRLPNQMLSKESRREHLGIDFVADKGTPVLAPAPGRVVKSGLHALYGNTLELDHGVDTDGRRIHTIYKHLDSKIVTVGDVVARGQQLGGLGRTGVLSSGLLHLHFEVWQEDKRGNLRAVDPGLYWTGGRGRVECFDNEKTWASAPIRMTLPVICE